MPDLRLLPIRLYLAKDGSGFVIDEDDGVVFELPFGWVVVVPKGFLWNGASIPSWANWFIGDRYDPKFLMASLLHDYLCVEAERLGDKEARHLADVLFYTKLKEVNVVWWKRKAMYYAVLLWGRHSFWGM